MTLAMAIRPKTGTVEGLATSIDARSGINRNVKEKNSTIDRGARQISDSSSETACGSETPPRFYFDAK
jgi:hypothetical protein